MDNDKFQMWRTAIATVFLDKKLAVQEKSWVEEKLATLKFSPEQKEIIEQDLTQETDLVQLFEGVEKPQNRSFVIHLMRVISHLDGDFDSQEERVLNKIRQEVLGKIDLSSFETELNKIDREMDDIKVYNKSSIFEKVFKKILELFS